MAVRILLLAAIVAASPASAASSRSGLTVVRVVSTVISKHDRDVAPKGWSAGDSVAFSDKLTNAVAQFGRSKGVRVGSDQGVVRFVKRGVITLTGTATLPDGTIRIKGRISPRPHGYVVPVSGGTGRYASARGTVKVVNMSKDGSVTLNVYTLSA